MPVPGRAWDEFARLINRLTFIGSVGLSASFCGTYPIVRFLLRSIAPFDGSMTPAIILTSELFPAPFGPITVVISLVDIAHEIRSNTDR